MRCYTIHGTNCFTKQWFSVLPDDTISVTTGDSNPHSADHKHQSLNSVLLTAWPRHLRYRSIYSRQVGKAPRQRYMVQDKNLFITYVSPPTTVPDLIVVNWYGAWVIWRLTILLCPCQLVCMTPVTNWATGNDGRHRFT